MHGDFSLNPLAYRDHVSRVLYQQGRVQLDSDVNELTESLLRAARGLASDVIGPHGGLQNSFEIRRGPDDFLIRWGEYYVDGLRCVNLPKEDFWDSVAKPPATFDEGLPFREQPWVFRSKADTKDLDLKPGLFYLDAFEHSVSPAQDDSLRESALMGADTSSRAILVWQVRKLTPDETRDWNNVVIPGLPHLPDIYDRAYLQLNLFLRPGARLAARATLTETTDPCVISPDASYRGLDNRLFRVEIHEPGGLLNGKLAGDPKFKFSRDNGAEVYPIRTIEGTTVLLESLGRDQRTALRVNDWVEVVDDEVLLMQKALPLLQVLEVNRDDMTITLSDEPKENAGSKPALHPILRRWAGPPMPIRLRDEKKPKANWIDLADGVEVQFSLSTSYRTGFRTGDYWLIPARTATADVVWPRDAKGHALALAPHGVEHHYAPLERWDGGSGTAPAFTSLRRPFFPVTMLKKA